MIALDVMGGDHAPEQVLRGAVKASASGVPVVLFGPKNIIHHLLQSIDPCWERIECLRIIDAPQCISMDEEPVSAVRRKRQSSLVAAVQSVANGQCSGVVSAGNSGALMAAALLGLGRQAGVDRAAIAGFLPARGGQRILALDLGANTECRPEHLCQFAQLGSDYVRKNKGIASPRVALLSNGHEEGKGSLVVKQAHQLLKASALNFVGNCEPYVFVQDDGVDVVVCDGFSGNILLKTLEASLELCGDTVGRIAGGQDAQEKVRRVVGDLDYRRIGGAPLLGVNGTVIVCHGGSDACAIEHALRYAWDTSSPLFGSGDCCQIERKALKTRENIAQ